MSDFCIYDLGQLQAISLTIVDVPTPKVLFVFMSRTNPNEGFVPGRTLAVRSDTPSVK